MSKTSTIEVAAQRPAVTMEEFLDRFPTPKDAPPNPNPYITYVPVFVTPAVALWMLDRNLERNRNEKPAKVRQISRDMGNNKFKLTGDPILVAKGLIMVDGGQRMRSVLRANSEYPGFRGVWMIFAFEVEEDAVFVVDTNAGRTFADTLKIHHAINQTQCGAIVRRIHVWNQGNRAYLRSSGGPFVDPTMTELRDLYLTDVGKFDAAAARGMDIRGQKIGNATAAGVAAYLFEKIDREAYFTFFDGLATGANLAENSPILVLRNRLLRANSRLDRNDWLTVTEQLYFYIMAWNAFLRDDTMYKLQLPDRREIHNGNMPKPMAPKKK